MNWDQAVNQVAPHVVKIETPGGHGTGFLCFYNTNRTFCAIATAEHVVAHADKWQEPVRLIRHGSSAVETAFLKEEDRLIFSEPLLDSAIVLASMTAAADLKLPENLVPMRPISDRLPTGTEVGWLGFPGLAGDTDRLCFFSGMISAWEAAGRRYLVDGVSVHGVSGGPVFCVLKGELQIVGAITAYIVNRATGESLPGLALAQDVSHFHTVYGHIMSVDEVRKRQEEIARKAAETPKPDSTPGTT